jgi:hypothetical protein
LGQLCRLEPDCAIKSIFSYKTSEYIAGNITEGFLPEIYGVLHKYDLQYTMDKFVSDGTFPSQYAWKRLVKERTKSAFLLDWNSRTLSPIIRRFREIHETFQYSHLWQFARTYRHYITHIKAVVQLVAYLVRFDGICKHCSAEHSENFTDHLLLDCTHVASIRNNMYHAIENLFSIDLATALSRLERVQLVKILFGVWQPVLYPHVSDNEKYTQFLFLTYKFVASMLNHYKWN